MWYNLISNGRALYKDFLFMTNVNELSDLKSAVLKLDDAAYYYDLYYDSFVISNDDEGHIKLFVNCKTRECALTCMAARKSCYSEEYKIPWDELNVFLDIYRTFRDGREGMVAHKFQKLVYNYEYEKKYSIGYTTDCKFVSDWIKTFGVKALTCTKYDTAAISEVNKYYYFFVLSGWIDDTILSQLLKEYEEFYEYNRTKKRWNNNV